MGSRRRGRVIAFQTLFSWEVQRSPVSELLEFNWLEPERRATLGEDVLSFAAGIAAGTIENIDLIDNVIKKNAEHWDIDRIAKVDLAILRISAYALLLQPDIPATVTINEAVEIAKKYGGGESYKFVNGILDSIRKDRGES
jgi:transcription antitermination protein NusB